jgi:hypothetical protein
MWVDDYGNIFQEGNDLAVFDRELIRRKSLHYFLQSNCFASNECKEVEIMAAKYLLPFLKSQMTHIFRALRKISNKASSEGCILRHHLDFDLQLIAFDTPTHLLVLELGKQVLPTCLCSLRLL